MKLEIKTFRGGYRFKNFEGQPEDKLIEIGIPEKVIIPLKQGFSAEVPPLVKPGDKVKAGQIIARDDNSVSTPVHSTVNGTVVEIKKINYFKQEITCVLIKSDGTTDFQRLEGYTLAKKKVPVEKLEELLYLSGVTSLDRGGIPTRFKSSIIQPQEVENIIVHGVGSEPYNISLSVLLGGKKIFDFVYALRVLNAIMPQAKIYLALNKHNKKLIEELFKLTAEFNWIEICPLEPKYPQGYDEVLVTTLLGKKYPYGYSAASIGVVVLNIQAALHIYDAVAEGKPLIERTIALCGPGFKENIHIKVRIGTPLEFIVKDRLLDGSRLVLNSPLTGFVLNDFSLPIDRTYSQIVAIKENKEREFLSFIRAGVKKDSYTRTFLSSVCTNIERSCDTNIHGERRPCISCSFCEEVCPVGIIPHLLYKYVVNNIISLQLLKFGIFNCIECGLCSYVCPSKIQLVEYIRQGQQKLINSGCDHSLCIEPYFNLRGIEEYRGIKKL
jgi:Na(+)-translocating NADH:ubiquinone oxidoreductase A subunit